MYSEAQKIITDPAGTPKTTYDEAERLQQSVENLIAETTAAIAIYDRFISTDPMADAVKDRSVTSTLKRANDGDD